MSERPRILCVDDEKNVLAALQRQLRQHFDVEVADSATRGMQMLAHRGPFHVVVSDLRMPTVDGISFLAKVREKSPDSSRILLTGYADTETAIQAVNRGQIFRFLTKPTGKDDLVHAIGDGARQYELLTSERALLEQTLRGAVQALVEVLSLASPVAFSRAQRARETVVALCEAQSLRERWPVEMAASLSQVGCITLYPSTLEKLHHGLELDVDESEAVAGVSAASHSLLQHIPRLGPVLEILEHHMADFRRPKGEHPQGADIPVGARMLRLALDLDDLEQRGQDTAKALEILRGREKVYDPELLEALSRVREGQQRRRMVRELGLEELQENMLLAEDLCAANGALLVARGHRIGPGLILRLKRFAMSVGLKLPILVAIEEEAEDDSTPEADPADSSEVETAPA